MRVAYRQQKNPPSFPGGLQTRASQPSGGGQIALQNFGGVCFRDLGSRGSNAKAIETHRQAQALRSEAKRKPAGQIGPLARLENGA